VPAFKLELVSVAWWRDNLAKAQAEMGIRDRRERTILSWRSKNDAKDFSFKKYFSRYSMPR
jgi:hypothetical protein